MHEALGRLDISVARQLDDSDAAVLHEGVALTKDNVSMQYRRRLPLAQERPAGERG